MCIRDRNARAEVVEDAGHAPQLQRPAETAALIAAFRAGLGERAK